MENNKDTIQEQVEEFKKRGIKIHQGELSHARYGWLYNHESDIDWLRQILTERDSYWLKKIKANPIKKNTDAGGCQHDYKFSHYEEDKNISSTATVNGKYAIMICRHCGDYIKRYVF